MNVRLTFEELERIVELTELNSKYRDIDMNIFYALAPLYNELKNSQYNGVIIVEGRFNNEN